MEHELSSQLPRKTYTIAELEITLRSYANNYMGLMWTSYADIDYAKSSLSFAIVALLLHLQVPKTAEVENLIVKVIHASAIFYYNTQGSRRDTPLEGAVASRKIQA